MKAVVNNYPGADILAMRGMLTLGDAALLTYNTLSELIVAFWWELPQTGR